MLNRQNSRGSFSTRSISSTSPVSLIERMRYGGHAPSVYGGAGGFGTRISQSPSAFLPYQDTSIIDEKLTMQKLNDRLASYLETVRTLEEANRKLELQIREFFEKKTSIVSKDFSSYYSIISELQDQIKHRTLEKERTLVQIASAQMIAVDFSMKYENELNQHLMLEADMTNYRKFRDSLTLEISDLEIQIEELNEERLLLKKKQEEDMDSLRIQKTGSVNVEVESANSVDLSKVLAETREQYEALLKKNQTEAEKWFKSKEETLETKPSTETSEVQTFYAQRTDLKRTLQNRNIDWNSVNSEEMELQKLKSAIEDQQAEYIMLLDVKMRLELEIAEYRRLLNEEHVEKKEVVQEQVQLLEQVEQVEVVEEVKHNVEKRTKIIFEELVDGVVVSRNVEVKVENVSNHNQLSLI
ncbi:keratin, type I cytoskeletal 20-like isoform X2 [Channa argus]|uniref:keratin, type I cytoskeletal 20-like isoform X2 n=1 Tax=Channa argus TaxID=215402 RepID=UPI003522248D